MFEMIENDIEVSEQWKYIMKERKHMEGLAPKEGQHVEENMPTEEGRETVTSGDSDIKESAAQLNRKALEGGSTQAHGVEHTEHIEGVTMPVMTTLLTGVTPDYSEWCTSDLVVRTTGQHFKRLSSRLLALEGTLLRSYYSGIVDGNGNKSCKRLQVSVNVLSGNFGLGRRSIGRNVYIVVSNPRFSLALPEYLDDGMRTEMESNERDVPPNYLANQRSYVCMTTLRRVKEQASPSANSISDKMCRPSLAPIPSKDFRVSTRRTLSLMKILTARLYVDHRYESPFSVKDSRGRCSALSDNRIDDSMTKARISLASRREMDRAEDAGFRVISREE
ncbi:hypothetical protein ARMGADRAFT_1038507 [Armillaria gallica]|uniref:Uncharacterized protein n=1 Tax=Armillaria gallica TaxID=47427 RepID=A0A2H3CMK4_ARMGA|nr:hypothetical protein ARMGADRAFT_1038507 [Armillaria gallica]